MSRVLKLAVAVLLLGVAVGVIYLRGLHERLLRLARPERTEARARREVTQPPIATPSDRKVKTRVFWASADNPGMLEPVEVELPLSAEPVQRAKQVLNTLMGDAPSPERRTLPEDAVLLEFYLLADGTAIADFSGAVATGTPSGILSEQMAVDSIARTLEGNVPGIVRLKILVNGQEAETLAGHVDLTGFFTLQPPQPATPPAAAPEPAKPQPGKLTASGSAVRLPR